VIGVRRAPRPLTLPIACSALLHASVLVPLILLRTSAPPFVPPLYKVNLLAAPPAPRAVGVVSDVPAPSAPAKAPPKAAARPAPAKAPPKVKVTKATKAPVQATPNVAKQPPAKAAELPKAGGGAVGGKGADVATVRTEGIEFPFRGYLDNITRQVALNFAPRGNVGALRCEVFFMIRRDGTVAGFKFLTRSGSQAFDLEAQGAVEAASSHFGRLPEGYADDVLPVTFYFDPSKLR
jgi:protein TonB